MKTKKQIQKVIDEINVVCEKHGICLIGSDDDMDELNPIIIADGQALKYAGLDLKKIKRHVKGKAWATTLEGDESREIHDVEVFAIGGLGKI